MHAKLSKQAINDLNAIYDYIAKDNLYAASKTITKITHTIELLETFPLIGRQGKIEGTREIMPCKPYIIVYQLSDDDPLNIKIERVLHASRQWPSP